MVNFYYLRDSVWFSVNDWQSNVSTFGIEMKPIRLTHFELDGTVYEADSPLEIIIDGRILHFRNAPLVAVSHAVQHRDAVAMIVPHDLQLTGSWTHSLHANRYNQYLTASNAESINIPSKNLNGNSRGNNSTVFLTEELLFVKEYDFAW